MSIIEELRQNIDLYNEEEKKKKELEEKKFLEIKEKNILNTNNCWEKYILPGIKEQSKKGYNTWCFRLVPNAARHFFLTSDSGYKLVCRHNNYDVNYFNNRLKLHYDFPVIENAYLDLDKLIEILKTNQVYCDIVNGNVASTKTGKYLSNWNYKIIKCSWKTKEEEEHLNYSPESCSFLITEKIIFPKEKKEDIITIKASSSQNDIKKERNKLTAGLRYDILKRDNFKCQICGRSAQDGIKLHVDHIIPVSKGGLTTWNNLRTLCQDCNLGKSNKTE